jgi:hypothetical protein
MSQIWCAMESIAARAMWLRVVATFMPDTRYSSLYGSHSLAGSPLRLDRFILAERNRLRAVATTPEIYNRDYIKGSITNPDPAVRSRALKLLNEATELAKELDCDYVKLWFGQDGWDYLFQVDYHDIWSWRSTGCGSSSPLTRRSSS